MKKKALKFLRLIAIVNMATPTEASGEFFHTFKNNSNERIEVYSFPRPLNKYFQRLEVLDSSGRCLEILKQRDPQCREGQVCVILSPPVGSGEQRTIVVKYSFVPEIELKGTFIRSSLITISMPAIKDSSAYLHVLPPENMTQSLLDVKFFSRTYPTPVPVKDIEILATPEMGSRYISLRFEPNQDGQYIIRIKIKYPETLRKWLLSLPIIGFILSLSNILIKTILLPILKINLSPIPVSLILALMAALIGTRIWLFHEVLMKNLSYLYLATLLAMIIAIIL